MNSKLLVTSVRNSVLAGVYVFGISQFLFYAETFFKDAHNQNFIPFVMLLLLCLSAATVGSLVFGQSVVLFLENKRQEGIQALIYSLGSLAAITLLALLIFILVK